MVVRKKINTTLYHVIVMGLAIIMIYPLVWMICSSFKPTETVFTTANQLLPKKAVIENYIHGWAGFANVSFRSFFSNSLFVCFVGTIGAVFSSYIVGYGMARLRFPGRKLLFTIMLVTMMLPGQILMIPQYLWFQKLGWVNTYLPQLVPAFFSTSGFFIYLIMNFIDGIPRELDEAAKIDGCTYFQIAGKVIFPLTIPAIVTVTLFSFMWKWDDYLTPLLYLQKTEKYTVSLALKLFCDPSSSSDYGAMFAMATLSLVPIVMLFIFFQKYITDGISTSGMKG